MFLYHTDIVYPKTKKELTVYKNCYLLEKDGAVEGIYPVIPECCRGVPVRDFTGMVMIPAFSDPDYAHAVYDAFAEDLFEQI